MRSCGDFEYKYCKDKTSSDAERAKGLYLLN